MQVNAKNTEIRDSLSSSGNPYFRVDPNYSDFLLLINTYIKPQIVHIRITYAYNVVRGTRRCFRHKHIVISFAALYNVIYHFATGTKPGG